MDETKALPASNGYVETIFGRRITIPEIRPQIPPMRAFNERAAINAPIQGTAADIIRRAMVRMDAALAEAELSTRACCCRCMTNWSSRRRRRRSSATLPVIARHGERGDAGGAMSVPLHGRRPRRQQLGRSALRRFRGAAGY